MRKVFSPCLCVCACQTSFFFFLSLRFVQFRIFLFDDLLGTVKLQSSALIGLWFPLGVERPPEVRFAPLPSENGVRVCCEDKHFKLCTLLGSAEPIFWAHSCDTTCAPPKNDEVQRNQDGQEAAFTIAQGREQEAHCFWNALFKDCIGVLKVLEPLPGSVSGK